MSDPNPLPQDEWVAVPARAGQAAADGWEARVADLLAVNARLQADIADCRRAESRWRDGELRYRRLIESAHDWVWEVDAEGLYTFAGPQVRDLLGYEPAELLGKSPFDLMSPEEAERVGAIFGALAARRQPFYHLENVNRHRDGRLVVLETNGIPIFDESGSFCGYAGMDRDITARRQAEAALAEERNLLRTLIDTLPDHIYIKDRDGRTLLANVTQARALGLNGPDELIGQADAELLYRPDESEALRRNDLTAMAAEQALVFEEAYTTPSGETRSFSTTKAALRDLQGNVVGVVGISHDITRRKQMEEEVRQERDRAEQYLNTAEVLLMVLDAHGAITLMNRKGHRILDYADGELLGKNWMDTCLPARVREETQAVFRRLIAGEADGLQHHENPVVTARGEERLIAWHNTLLKDSTGRIVGILSSGEDITERRQLEEQLRQAQKMEAMGTLAGGVAHDFNNLLTVILGNGALILKGLAPDDPLRPSMVSIKQAADRATGLTRQLLAFSRRQVLQPRILNVNTVIAEETKMLRRLIGEDITLITTPAPDLWPVKADPGSLAQVIMNLVVNAREAMPQGGRLTLETANTVVEQTDAALRAGVTPGPYIVLTVSDTGVGMDPAMLGRMFEPFFTTKERGTGLGLATVYGIVEQSGGHLRVDSEPGRGATFRVYLPPATAESTPASRGRVAEPLAGGAETVLLVEDDQMVREFSRRCLKELGYQVLDAGNGAEALEVIRTHPGPIHLLMTDVVMPDLNGPDLARQLRAAQPGLPIVFVSGYTAGFFGAQSPLPAGRILEKPFTLEALDAALRQALDERR